MAKTDNIQIINMTDNRGRTHRIGYSPVTTTNTSTPQGLVAEPVPPAWVKQAGFKNWNVALELIIRDLLAHFAAVQVDKVEAYCAPLRVSDGVAPGSFWLDEQGLITVNECWAKDRALDSDGDNAFIIWTRDRKAAYFVKYPLTQVVPLLYLQTERPLDTWGDYDESLERWDPPKPLTELEIREGFLKVHEAGQIGPKTNAWDAQELFQAKQAQMTYLETCCHLLSDIGRFYDLEGDLKKNRAGLGAKVIGQVTTIGGTRYVVEDSGRWRLQGKVGTVDMKTLTSILLNADFNRESHMEDRLEGLPFKRINAARPLKSREEPVRPTFNQIDHTGRNFTQRLERLGVVVWEDHGHEDPSLPPCQVMRVYYRVGPKDAGRKVALQDERREGGMHQQWYLPPVCVLKDGQPLWFPASAMLEQELADIKTRQKRGGVWPQTHGQIKMRPNKAAQLQQAIQRFVNKYGLPTVESNEFKTLGQYIGRRMFTVDYGTNLPEKMWERVQPLRQWFAANSEYQAGLLGGVKGSSKPWRRYLIAHPETLVPSVLPLDRMKSLNRCSPKRIGELHSQLAQSIPVGWTAAHNTVDGHVLPQNRWQTKYVRLFIFGGSGTRGQLYAFPSGQRLQTVPGVFLPQVNEHPDEDYGVTVARSYCTLSGEEKVAFTSEARPTIAVGKLVSMYGMKNYCGVEMEQLKALTSRGMVDVDFAINQHELMSAVVIDEQGREWKGKGCLEAMLEAGEAVKASVMWNGQRVHGRIVEVSLLRTTTPSENTRPETRVRSTSAVAKHAIRAALMEPLRRYGQLETDAWLNWSDRALALTDQPRLKERDLNYVHNLQHAARIIGCMAGACSAPQPSVVVNNWLQDIEMEDNEQ